MRVTCAGRTDKGVHALGQVVSFDLPDEGDVDLDGLRRSVNNMGGGRVVVRSAAIAPSDFDARHSARWRCYRYLVDNGPTPDPLQRHVAWWVPAVLSLDALRQATTPLIGTHDFAAFCRRPALKDPAAEPPGLTRQVIDADWSQLSEGQLRFEIKARSFCHQMVRSIVGLLVDVGRGKRRAADVASVLSRGDRRGVPTLAPPHGLTLWEVGY